jgi:hypothetical protein
MRKLEGLAAFTAVADAGSISEATLTGPLRLSAAVSFGCPHLAPALIGFMKQHPGSRFDAVIRHGPVGDGRLIAHRLTPGGRVLIASPVYLAAHGEPRSLEAMEGRRAHRETGWRFQAAGGVRVARPTAELRVNNGMFVREAALALPCLVFERGTRTVSVSVSNPRRAASMPTSSERRKAGCRISVGRQKRGRS